MDSETICFMCGQNSVHFHLVSGESEFNIIDVISQHFWFEEDVLQSAIICEPCWEKVDQFHRFYQEVKQHYDQMMQPDMIFIKQEQIEFEDEGKIQETCTDIQTEHEGNPLVEENKLEIDCMPLAIETDCAVASTSKPKTTKSKQIKLTPKQQKEDEFIKQHRSYNCDECPMKFESFTTILRHSIDDHGKSYISCCNVKYRCRSKLFQHVQSLINPEASNAFKCEICGKSYTVKSIYVRHKMEVHPTEEQLIFKCDRCPKRFPTQVLLQRHIATHETLEKQKAKCDICGKCFRTQAYLKEHMDTIHEKKANFICEICSKPFARRQNFVEHKLTHELTPDQLKRQCPICKRWQKNPRSWKKHLKRHDNEGAYKCGQCDHVSINLLSLNLHIERRHTINRKLVCDLCGKEYSREVTLKEHIANAHTKTPLYRCQFCQKTFFSNASMYSHRKKAHPKEWENFTRTKYSSKDTENNQK